MTGLVVTALVWFRAQNREQESPMKARVYISSTIDVETAETLEREALQRKMHVAPLVREVLEAYAARVRAAKAQTTQAQNSVVRPA